MSITLTELLASRDARVEHQKELAEKYPRASLICFTVMLPGSVKRDWRSLLIADAGVVAIRQVFGRFGHLASPQKKIIFCDGAQKTNFLLRTGPSREMPGSSSVMPDLIGHLNSVISTEVEKSLLLYQEERDLETGFEAYFVVDMPALEVKRLCCSIEDEHPLGRLMDIDVVCHFDRSGEISLKPLSREDIGLPARHCLLCNKPARECMRAHRHSPEEIQDTIDRMVQDYKFSK